MKNSVKQAQEEPLKVNVSLDIKGPQKLPWPYKDESISELVVCDVFEYVPGKDRGKFMDEVYRVLIPEGKANFMLAYWNTARAIQDYRYEWPPLCEQSFLYFNKGWRDTNKLKLDMICDFDFTYGYNVDPDTSSRSDEVRSFNLKNYTNVVQVLQIMLTKRSATK